VPRAGAEAVVDADPRAALIARVRARLLDSDTPPSPAVVAAAVRREGRLLPEAEVVALAASLDAALHGLGPLDALVRDPAVTDVLVNAPAEVWVDRGVGLERAEVAFADDAAVRSLAQRLASRCGRRLDDASPCVDARLPGGMRLHAVLPPVSAGATLLSLRLARRAAFSLDDLVDAGALPPLGAEWLRAMVRARCAFVLTGGTGTGKTTVLSALLGEVDPAHRVVTVEDVCELRPAHPHVVSLEARAANVEGAGAVTVRDLVREALRMRPDRLVVGEARGGEVVDLLGAMNTGHEGSASTLHANAPAAVPARLEALGALAGLDRDALHAQVLAALDAIVHLVREPSGRRRVAAIGVLRRASGGGLEVVDALMLGSDGEVRAGPGERALRRAVER